MKILLATQGSQGVVAIRELFALGYTPNDLDIVMCAGRYNGPLEEFLKYNEIPLKLIASEKEFNAFIAGKFLDHILLSISWKYKFSGATLSLFKGRAINFHPGLLPGYKGCYSIPWAIINGESQAGFTYHYMNEKLDDGNILLEEKFEIRSKDTAHSLNYRIFQKGLSMIGVVLEKIGQVGEAQCGAGKYYSNELPFGGVISPDWDMEYCERFIRAMYFPPFKPAIFNKNDCSYPVVRLEQFMEMKNV